MTAETSTAMCTPFQIFFALRWFGQPVVLLLDGGAVVIFTWTTSPLLVRETAPKLPNLFESWGRTPATKRWSKQTLRYLWLYKDLETLKWIYT